MVVKVGIVCQYKLFGSPVNLIDLALIFGEVQTQKVILVVAPCKYFTSTRDCEALSVAGINLTYFILLDFFLNEHGLLGETIPLQLYLLVAQLLIFAPFWIWI